PSEISRNSPSRLGITLRMTIGLRQHWTRRQRRRLATSNRFHLSRWSESWMRERSEPGPVGGDVNDAATTMGGPDLAFGSQGIACTAQAYSGTDPRSHPCPCG